MNMCQIDLKLVYVLFFFGAQTLGQTCYTPDKRQGHCVPLNECPKVFDTFANPPKGSETHLRQFLCKDDQQLKVCCGTANYFSLLENYSIPDPADISKQIIDNDVFTHCNIQSLSDINLPVILAEGPEVQPKKCLGVMANFRYVITPAQCVVSNAQRQQFKLVRIQLRGKSNHSITFDVEEIISHPFFDPVSGVNDIALLRLNQTVSNEDVPGLCKTIPWTTSIPTGRPIFIYSDLDLATIERGLAKTRVSTTLLSKEDCEQKFLQRGAHVVVTEYDLCTNKIENYTTSACNEFTGVPLFIDFYVTGFIGFSSSRTVCNDGLPDIYTNVNSYRDWLKDQMKPWPIKNDPCTTPNGQTGKCWHVLHCPAFLDVFSDVTIAAEAYLREFICEREEEEGEFSVCCATSSNFTIVHRENAPKLGDLPTKFLETRLCGLQHRDDYFSSSPAVAIDEFPWLAIIESSFSRCTGTLINSRYVLTTGHCVVVDLNTAIVRLGDYLRYNETSCVKDPDVDATDCTETEIYGIENIIQHPFYMRWFSVNDIGLLRLNKTVPYYTDFVRPICLPIPGTLTAKVGDTMYMSSWGAQLNRTKRGIKKKVWTQLIEKAECQRQLRKQTSYNYIKHFNRICTLDYQNNTEFASANDEGAPLMYQNNYRWQIEGLVFKFSQSSDLPVVYVDVSRYINWIVASMKPW